MRTIVLQEPRHFVRADIPEPPAPGPNEALVRVHRVGICGTDISGYLGKMPFYSYPRIPGHELGVEVVAIGSEVGEVQPGDRCAVEPYINNPQSFASRRGHPNCCNDLRVLGVHTDGGMRPYFLVPARKLHPSRTLAMEQLALVETLGIGCHAVDRAAPEKDEFLLVIGAGPIGLSVIEFARLAGVQIIVMDINEQRLEFCRQTMGVQHTVLFRGDNQEVEQLRKVADGHLPTIVIDATGNPQSMSGALQYVEHSGKLVYVGITTQEIHFSHRVFHAPEMTLLASRNSLPADFRRIIQLIESEQLDTRPWITHRTDFDRLIDEFESYTQPSTGVIKAIVEVPDS